MRASFVVENPTGSITIFDHQNTMSPKQSIDGGLRVFPDHNVHINGQSVSKISNGSQQKSFIDWSVNKQSYTTLDIAEELEKRKKCQKHERYEETGFILKSVS